MFYGLKLYTVHTKPGGEHGLQEPLFLREGFSLVAFIFTLFWALYHRLWHFAVIIFLMNICVALAVHFGMLNELTSGIVQLGIALLAGFSANDALHKKLQKRGYVFADITSGDSLLRAEQRYFDRLTV